jgi:hypothetical protein
MSFGPTGDTSPQSCQFTGGQCQSSFPRSMSHAVAPCGSRPPAAQRVADPDPRTDHEPCQSTFVSSPCPSPGRGCRGSSAAQSQPRAGVTHHPSAPVVHRRLATYRLPLCIGDAWWLLSHHGCRSRGRSNVMHAPARFGDGNRSRVTRGDRQRRTPKESRHGHGSKSGCTLAA